jgi:hypothetical protein
MQEEEKDINEGAQEPQAEAEGEAKPKKAIPKVPKGKFKKPEKADLSTAKGKFAKKKGGPVDKPSLDRFHKKAGMNPKILYAIIGVVVVLVAVFFLFGGSTIKNHTAYVKARLKIYGNPSVQENLGEPLHDPGTPKYKEGQDEKGRNTIEFEHAVEGSKGSAPFKARGTEYRGTWEVLYLEVTVGGSTEVLIDKEITDRGIMRKSR